MSQNRTVHKVKIPVIAAVAAMSILAFGYWHSATHSSLYVSLNLVPEADKKAQAAPAAKVQFLDSQGSVLANGVRDEQYNFVHLVHPEYGDCHEVEKMAAFSNEARSAWQECFEHLSVWIARWIGDVAHVSVRYENCLIEKRPITISKSRSDWYLWWVPHPHIGGKPYSDYSATIVVDEKDCVEIYP